MENSIEQNLILAISMLGIIISGITHILDDLEKLNTRFKKFRNWLRG